MAKSPEKVPEKSSSPKKSSNVCTINISGVTSNVRIDSSNSETQDDYPCELMSEPPSGEKGLMNNPKKFDGTKKPHEYSIVKSIIVTQFYISISIYIFSS